MELCQQLCLTKDKRNVHQFQFCEKLGQSRISLKFQKQNVVHQVRGISGKAFKSKKIVRPDPFRSLPLLMFRIWNAGIRSMEVMQDELDFDRQDSDDEDDEGEEEGGEENYQIHP